MIFTKMGKVLAVGAILIGVLRVVMTIAIIQSDNPAAMAREYLGSNPTGYYIDQGIRYVIFGIVIGILTDISRTLSSKT